MLPKSSKRSLVGLLSIAIAGGILGNLLHLTHGFGVEDWVRSKYLELQQWSRCWDKKQEYDVAGRQTCDRGGEQRDGPQGY
jgi:hypothetical protein